MVNDENNEEKQIVINGIKKQMENLKAEAAAEKDANLRLSIEDDIKSAEGDLRDLGVVV